MKTKITKERLMYKLLVQSTKKNFMLSEKLKATNKQRDELLKLLKKAQLSVEILINHIPTGRMRNILTEDNITILSLIEKTENQCTQP